ncbi:extracellular solute-binding protein [Butyrivibrio sp. LC3010]|uniref:extracellular solute-binding protein n=1 Tax=Butyrivibrio sp. LC3010 TaxID=1280680 RepID=UPI000429132F|nr:extracellular solute-binding protein [Butyrivibrio sp. LC3010]
MVKQIRAFSALFMAISLFISSGCSEKPKQEEIINSPADRDVNSITCMVWDRGNFPAGYDADNNTLANWIRAKVKEECGIDLHFVSVKRENSDDEINRMIDNGTAPDILFTYTPSEFGYLARQGKVADLTDSYKKYGKDINKYIGDIQHMGIYNDHQVAILKRRGFKEPRHVAYIRKDWCDALGMNVPSTKEELIDYLYAVKKNDPGGVSDVIPWAMGGDINSERFYQSFVNSFVGELTERDAFIYSERYMVVAEGALEGLKELNRLYNDGLITLDFTADRDNSLFISSVDSGRAGFIVDDSTRPFSSISKLKEKDPSAKYVPVLCFEGADGKYRNVTEPDHGMYIMVSAASRDKTDAAMKYLNWLSDPQNAEMVNFTPDHLTSESGAAMAMSREDLFSHGYPGNPDDYCIVNAHFDFVDDKNAQISTWAENCEWEDYEWFENFYNICVTDRFTFPVSSAILESEAKYQINLDKALVEYAYNLICCPRDDFEKTSEMEYKRLKELGLEEVLEERAKCYDSGEYIR